MAKGRKFEGVGVSDELSQLKVREDLRSIPEKLRDLWLQPWGQQYTLVAFATAALVFIWVPLSGEFIFCLIALFSWVKLSYKKKAWDFPFRVPISANLIDGSNNRPGKGLMYLGSEVSSKLPVFISDNDARTHALIFGTTGSGKTELLLGFVVNSLFYNGGASYTDGKGDVKLWLKFLNATRMVGREHDLLLISFITSGKEFYDRQETLPSNTLNPYSNGSSGMCTEASIALMDSGGGDDMWKGRAIAFLGGLIKPLVFLRDQGEILLSADLIRSYFDLPVLERFVYDEEDIWKGGIKRPKGYFSKKYGKIWDVVIRPLKAFMVTIPGYDISKLGKQEQKTLEQHGYITMQLARLFGDLADNYGHIMDTPLGHVDMFDVVINNRVLVTLLPALERSPESLGMLGKIIVGGIKQMAAGCLGNRVEGLRREIVDARPTNAPVPFPTIFDEYGYYAVLGFSSMPAQARSLGFMVIFAAQDFASLKKSSPEEADQTWENTNVRGIGRITSGGGAETYKRMEELGGTALVAEVSGYEKVFGLFRTRIRANEQIKLERKPRVQSDDLHSQADGEFHLFLGKKEKDSSEGRVRIARVNAFYTDIEPINKDKRKQPPVETLFLNHFARVLPPSTIVDSEQDVGLTGPRGLLHLMRAGELSHIVKNREMVSGRTTEMLQVEVLDRVSGGRRVGSLNAAILGVMVTVEGNEMRRNLNLQMAELAKRMTEGVGGGKQSGSGSSASSDGASSGAAGGDSGGPVQSKVLPRMPAAKISLQSSLAEGKAGKFVIPVTPNSPEEVRELVVDAQKVGLMPDTSIPEEVVRESLQKGTLVMSAPAFKDAGDIEEAIVQSSGRVVGDEERSKIRKHSQSLSVYLDQATSYIDEPTPDIANVRVSDADTVTNQLLAVLTNSEAPWSS